MESSAQKIDLDVRLSKNTERLYGRSRILVERQQKQTWRANRQLFSVLIILLFQLSCTPAHAENVLAGFGESLKTALVQKGMESVADWFGVKGKNPESERAMDAEAQQRAVEAKRLMGGAGARASPAEIASAPAHYNPKNKPLAKQQLARWTRFNTRTKQQTTLSPEDLREAAETLQPFLQYYVSGTSQKPSRIGNQVYLPPGQSTNILLRAYCLDASRAVPPRGEKLQLIPVSQLLPESTLALYQAMMQFSALHVEKRSEIQNLVWGLRHAADPHPPIKALNAEQTHLLNSITANGALQYQNLLQSQAQSGQDQVARQKLFRTLLGQAQERLGIKLPDPTQNGFTAQDTQTLLNQLARLPVEGTAQNNSEYSLLAPSVAARTTGQGMAAQVELQNHSDSPFIFDASDYAAQSTRVTQRLGFGGTLGDQPVSSAGMLERLDEILKALEIQKLKRLQKQIQATLDNEADRPGANEPKLAVLALGTALNQVLLPTSMLDVGLVATKPVKLLNLSTKLGAREVVALEEVVRRGALSSGELAEVWKLSPLVRGRLIEAHLAATEYKSWFNVGQLHNGKFPLVDFQKENVLISVKSVDTTGATWMRRMENHIVALGNTHATVDGKKATMILDLRVQPGGKTSAESLEKIAARYNVELRIKEFM